LEELFSGQGGEDNGRSDLVKLATRSIDHETPAPRRGYFCCMQVAFFNGTGHGRTSNADASAAPVHRKSRPRYQVQRNPGLAPGFLLL
jgi:hypothetical protein